MKILTVIGARPQFVKAAPVSKALNSAGHEEFLVHTGQHYDPQMSQIFFDEMGIPEPNINLEVGSGKHGWQTAQMLMGIEELLLEEKPDYILLYGDTNSTLAGSLAAVKLHISIAHVEAGLRSFNRKMPEEHNRVLTDHASDLLFCPTEVSARHLANEGIIKGVHIVGDVMYDAVLAFSALSEKKSTLLDTLNIIPNNYLLATVHRPANTDNAENLRAIFEAFRELDENIIFPVHPRTRGKITDLIEDVEKFAPKINLIEPVGYLNMLSLAKNAKTILTDSGGLQKEAYWLAIPCVTLRPETEWVETVNVGWNTLVGANKKKILSAVNNKTMPKERPSIYGDGHAAEKIAKILG
ncbi:MAG: UDP-N-acetylglucosamine 2-epimerase (non-hydrolyzing) [Anaerolineae bacterium]|jgi:UDP-N-acetylglucosamine 2-epimerase|nr:UDP-N-acetylglucosamine 2-epimerase (non-hydrolyzing) [Anaerolineae bacterium]MBT7774928.1 UDP-N-acetylglucosamine 2-epimerase (non-hydrolyzing) [Anaerolineae bacterium]